MKKNPCKQHVLFVSECANCMIADLAVQVVLLSDGLQYFAQNQRALTRQVDEMQTRQVDETQKEDRRKEDAARYTWGPWPSDYDFLPTPTYFIADSKHFKASVVGEEEAKKPKAQISIKTDTIKKGEAPFFMTTGGFAIASDDKKDEGKKK